MKNDWKLMDMISSSISNLDASTMVMTPLIVALFGLAGFIFFPNPKAASSYGIWMGFWFILTGLAIVIKKEIPRPGHRSIKGIAAVILGIFWVIFFGIITILVLVSPK